MILGKLKTYGLILLSGLLAVSTFLLKIFFKKSQKEEARADRAEAEADHAKDVMEADIEIDLERDIRTDELVKEVEETGTSKELGDPNRW